MAAMVIAACSNGAQGLQKGAGSPPTPTVAVDAVSTPTLPTTVPTSTNKAGDLPFGINLRREVLRTDHVRFYLAPDSVSRAKLVAYASQIEAELSEIAGRVGVDPSIAFPGELIITFVSPRSERVGPMELGSGQCPVRGVAITGRVSGPLQAWVVADDETPADQVIAVAAHEMAHHVGWARFGGIGDSLLAEGLATWLAQESWLRWHGWDSLDEAVRGFRSDRHIHPVRRSETNARIEDPTRGVLGGVTPYTRSTHRSWGS